MENIVKQGVRCIVSGRVQGVWFRANTQERASALKVSGWVRNLPDGRVELKAFGEEAALKQLCDWLWEGPLEAKVQAVFCEEIAWEKHQTFSVDD